MAAVFIQLAGTVGGYLHFALVRHERCPVHGELVHVDVDGPEGPGAAQAAPPHRGDADDESTVSLATSASQESHDVCSVTAALRRGATAPRCDRCQWAEPPRAAAGVPPAEDPFLVSRGGYRVAPKTSPPGRA